MSNISLAVYRNVFVLIVHIDDYEDGTRLQRNVPHIKRFRRGLSRSTVSMSAISAYRRPRKNTDLPRLSIRVMRVPRDIISLNCPRRKRQQFARHLSGLD